MRENWRCFNVAFVDVGPFDCSQTVLVARGSCFALQLSLCLLSNGIFRTIRRAAASILNAC
jgi:hypothetical protein